MPITEAEIERINEFNKIKHPEFPSWYGIKKGLYRYAGIPNWLPVNVFLNHGASSYYYRNDKPDYQTMHNSYPILFVNNSYQKNICRKYINKPIYILGAVYPHYRKKLHIQQRPDAKGTIAFPFHSTHLVSVSFDYVKYARNLKTLPERFQPVTVSVYWKEVIEGKHNIFKEEGLDVVTNGHMFDDEFINNFYRNISMYRFATGNGMGSWLCYAVEMGIPSFIYGDEAFINNDGGDGNTPSGIFRINKDFGYAKAESIERLFTSFDVQEANEISEEQYKAVKTIIGTNDCLSRGKIRLIVLFSLLQWIIKKFASSAKSIVMMTASKNLPQPVKNAVYYLISKDFREERRKTRMLQEITKIPRYTEGTTNILEKQCKFVDSVSFLSCYTSIFKNEMFNFRADDETPYIIDCGANIGLSVLYFKKLYPSAKITAFEPDKKIFSVLKENVEAVHLYDIELVNKGVWKEDSVQRFFSEGADAGRMAHASDHRNIIDVTMVSLRKYLNRPVDFLKVDIEGTETDVLKDCEDLLKNVKRLYVEYHSFVGEEQTLDELLSILRRVGFRVSINSPMYSKGNPFQNVNEYMGMDLQLDIFGYRK